MRKKRRIGMREDLMREEVRRYLKKRGIYDVFIEQMRKRHPEKKTKKQLRRELNEVRRRYEKILRKFGIYE